VRKKLGIRTIFNILGPLVNPARACHQLLGAGRPELRPLLAGAIQLLGTKRTFVVSGDDGLGDVTLAGTTNVTEVVAAAGSAAAGSTGGPPVASVREFTWQPEDFGIRRQSIDGLTIDSPRASAAVIRKVLNGERGAARDIVVLNAAAGILVAGRAAKPQAAADLAAEAIDNGAARQLLARLAARSHEPV
jgi:anthranilate phosphoribosyltransferase